MLAEVVKRGHKNPELVLFSLSAIGNLLNSLFTHQPDILLSEEVQKAFLNLFSVLSKSQSDSLRLEEASQDRGVWANFISIFVYLDNYTTLIQDRVTLFKLLASATDTKPWLVEFFSSEEVIKALFTGTVSKDPDIQLCALEEIRKAVNCLPVCRVYLSKHLMSNLVTRVIHQHPHLKPPIIAILRAVTLHPEPVWTLDETSEERGRLKGVLESVEGGELKVELGLVLGKA
mmetsp:Transcript_15448/g.27968  ORF Transcript_15448/g.27968 Transcript_15448/m.27968 type:complete len:231 (+) Transcript_15448:2081-2773(+)